MRCHQALFLICAILLPPSLHAGSLKQTEAIRLTQTVEIDGRLLEQVWQRPSIGDFTQKDPDEGKPSTQKTEVWICYDDEALYVGARLYDTTPDSIVSRIGRRDADLSADWFYVGIDSYYDRRTGFYFGVYAGGTIADGTLFNDSWDDDSWDGVWTSATTIDEGGWNVEMKIPYSQLRFPRQDAYVWGVNFGRNIERRKEESFYIMVPKSESGWVSRFADLVGIRDINPPQRLEVLPYVATTAEFTQHETGDPFNDGSKFLQNAGADVKIGIGSDFTLNATMNPDFGQVEVDPAVVNLTQFETFFQEKRPFFIEGSNFFSSYGFGGANNNWGFNFGTPDFFYSRRIGRAPQGDVSHDGFQDVPRNTTILGAAKFFGKPAGGWSVSSLHAVTEREYADVDSSGVRFSDVVEPLTYYGVTRALREFGEGQHALGAITTTTVRDLNRPYLKSDFNRTAYAAGLDGWTTLDDNSMWVLTGWFAGTRVEGSTDQIASVQRSAIHYYQRPDADHKELDSARTSLSGYGGRIALNKQKGNWYLNTAFGLHSPGFELNDLGFLFRSDIINGHIVTGYRWYEPDQVFRRKGIYAAVFRNYDFGGRRTADGYMMFGNAQFMNYWGIEGNFGFNPAYVDTRNTRGGPAMRNTDSYFGNLFAYSDSRNPFVIEMELGAGGSASGGYRYDISPGIIWKPTSRLSVSVSPTYVRDITIAQWVDSFEDATATATYGARYVFGRLDQKEVSASIRLDWTFTPKLTLQVFLQPLISVGHYTNFMELRQPDTYSFNRYSENGSTITDSDDVYIVDPDGPGPAPSFSFDDPDFNFKSLRGNAVLRWEYLPGSTLYVVWTQRRTNEEDAGEFNLNRDFSKLISSVADNIFLVKVAYWVNEP